MFKRYIALIRGINVGGNSIISMADLREVFEELGFLDVSTYIQSGNVLFSSESSNKVDLAGKIEERLASKMGRKVEVFVLSKEQLEAASEKNYFRPKNPDTQISHIVFLSEEPQRDRIETLKKMEGREYKFEVWKNVLYFTYSKEDAAGRRTIDFEKVLETRATARTWKVVDKLIELKG